MFIVNINVVEIYVKSLMQNKTLVFIWYIGMSKITVPHLFSYSIFPNCFSSDYECIFSGIFSILFPFKIILKDLNWALLV